MLQSSALKLALYQREKLCSAPSAKYKRKLWLSHNIEFYRFQKQKIFHVLALGALNLMLVQNILNLSMVLYLSSILMQKLRNNRLKESQAKSKEKGKINLLSSLLCYYLFYCWVGPLKQSEE